MMMGRDDGLVNKLKAELGATPVTTLVVVPDLSVRLHAEPVRHLAVLPRLARQLFLDEERLVRRLRDGGRWNRFVSCHGIRVLG